jgi:hypothetical protein
MSTMATPQPPPPPAVATALVTRNTLVTAAEALIVDLAQDVNYDHDDDDDHDISSHDILNNSDGEGSSSSNIVGIISPKKQDSNGYISKIILTPSQVAMRMTRHLIYICGLAVVVVVVVAADSERQDEENKDKRPNVAIPLPPPSVVEISSAHRVLFQQFQELYHEAQQEKKKKTTCVPKDNSENEHDNDIHCDEDDDDDSRTRKINNILPKPKRVLFLLTPGLFPSSKAQKQIETDVTRKLVELTVRADRMANQLLALPSSQEDGRDQENNHTRKKNETKKYVQQQQQEQKQQKQPVTKSGRALTNVDSATTMRNDFDQDAASSSSSSSSASSSSLSKSSSAISTSHLNHGAPSSSTIPSQYDVVTHVLGSPVSTSSSSFSWIKVQKKYRPLKQHQKKQKQQEKLELESIHVTSSLSSSSSSSSGGGVEETKSEPEDDNNLHQQLLASLPPRTALRQSCLDGPLTPTPFVTEKDNPVENTLQILQFSEVFRQESSPLPTPTPTPRTMTRTTEGGSRDAASSQLYGPFMSTHIESAATSMISTTTSTTNTTAPHRDDQIHQLERTVQELQQQLQHERENHARILKKEREDAQELLQGMQLRLHISETRTRTFEEALVAHVDAVAQNVALHPTKKKNNNSSSSSRSPIITLLNQSHPPSPSSPHHSSSRYLDNANTTHRTSLNPPRATLFSRGCSSSSGGGGTWRTPGVGDVAE